MDYILFFVLTNILFVGILFIYKKNKYKSIEYTQSNIHQIVKRFIPKDFFELPRVVSQSTKHVDKNTIKVIVLEDEAYWVHENMFYMAEMVNGLVDSETVKPVDTNNMSNRDIDKMLFILDSLKNGNSDDSSGTWNN
jgi:hypothetical protein